MSCFPRRTHSFYLFLLFFLLSCNFDSGFEFRAEYEATKSGYRIDLISRGYVEAGHDISKNAASLVQFCPLEPSSGTAFRISLIVEPKHWIKMECADFGSPPSDWNWRTAEKLLSEIIHRAGYTNLNSEELKGSVKVIENSTAGPKGVILEGQIESLRVLNTDISYGYALSRNKPKREWIGESDLPSCKTF